jgi:hypothetical protein
MMDVDMDPPTSSAGKWPSLPPHTSFEPSAKRTKLDSPDDQLAKVNNQINRVSQVEFWPQQHATASSDSDMFSFMSRILFILVRVLSTTDAKATTREELKESDADRLIENFTPEELKEWEAGVSKGLRTGDWTDLIAHRTSHSNWITAV